MTLEIIVAALGLFAALRKKNNVSCIGALKRAKRRVYVELEAAQQSGITFGGKYNELPAGSAPILAELGERFGWKQSSVSRASGKSYSEAYYNSLKRAYNAIAGVGVGATDWHEVRNDDGDVILQWRDKDAVLQHIEQEKEIEATRQRTEELEAKLAKKRRRGNNDVFRRMLPDYKEKKSLQELLLEKFPALQTHTLTDDGWYDQVGPNFKYVLWIKRYNNSNDLVFEGPKIAFNSINNADVWLDRDATKSKTFKDYDSHGGYLGKTVEKLIPVNSLTAKKIEAIYGIGYSSWDKYWEKMSYNGGGYSDKEPVYDFWEKYHVLLEQGYDEREASRMAHNIPVIYA